MERYKNSNSTIITLPSGKLISRQRTLPRASVDSLLTV